MIGRGPQQALGIQGEKAEVGVVGGPHTHCAGTGGLGGIKHGLTTKQNVIEGVGLAVACVPKDGEDFDACHVPTAEPVQKLRLIADLGGRGDTKQRAI